MQNPCGSPHKALQGGKRRYEGGSAGSEPSSPAGQEPQTRAPASPGQEPCSRRCRLQGKEGQPVAGHPPRSEEHTSELQSHLNLVCRLLLEKKKKTVVLQRLKWIGVLISSH